MPRLPSSPRGWAVAVVCVVSLVVVWHFSAYYRGALAATLDGIRGHDEIQTDGYPAPERWEYGRLLEERFGVELNEVAGCVVSERLCAYVAGYNDVVTRRVNGRHCRDVFAECRTEAEEQYRLKHPKGRGRDRE